MGGPRFGVSLGTDDPKGRLLNERSEILRQRHRPGHRFVIQNPVFLAVLLLGMVVGLLSIEKAPGIKKIFHYLPSAFWCYFIPMLLSTFGILPDHSPIYDFLTTYVLSACLLLLLLDINLPGILRLGPTALGAMAVGALGIAVGAVTAYAIFARWLP